VLREGIVVGLANHTILTAKDGRKTPIDDSGAPIKKDDGSIGGVILVFRDVSERKKNDDDMRALQQRFSKAFNENPVPMSIVSFEDGRYVDVNESFLQNSGYTRDEVVGHTTADINIYVDRRDRDRLREVLLRDGTIRNAEVHRRMKNGEDRIALASSELIDINGVRCVLTVNNDITERKRAEEVALAALEQKELLVKEVQHRVKNNLQVISSLINLQLGYARDREVLRIIGDIRNRINAISMIHDQLHLIRNTVEIEFGSYIRSLAEHLAISFGADSSAITIEVDAENVCLDVDTASPCGLIINEIVSNSFKHAFPDRRPGQIKIAFHRDGENQFSLSISDDGIGLREGLNLENSPSLGLRLITGLVKQLKGEIRRSLAGGTEFMITFAAMKYKERT